VCGIRGNLGMAVFGAEEDFDVGGRRGRRRRAPKRTDRDSVQTRVMFVVPISIHGNRSMTVTETATVRLSGQPRERLEC